MARDAAPLLIKDWHVELLRIDTISIHEAASVFEKEEKRKQHPLAEAEAKVKKRFVFHRTKQRKNMDLRKTEDVANDSKGRMLSVEKEALASNHDIPQNNQDTARQHFLDRIPVGSIPGINKNSPGADTTPYICDYVTHYITCVLFFSSDF